MLLIPGLELRNGHVALPNLQPGADEPLVFRDAMEVVSTLHAQGARRLHLIDADGASEGQPANTDRVLEFKRAFPDLVLEVTGGMRRIEHAELWLDCGADFVVLTWKLLRDPDVTVDLCTEYPGRVIVALEGVDGQLSNGREQLDVLTLANRYADEGVAAMLYTEHHAPGERIDPLAPAAAIAAQVDMPVICNGGVHDLDTVMRLRKAPLNKLAGVVMGRAILTGGIDYAAAVQAVKKK